MQREQRASIIDTLSSGYRLINRWPLLLAPPILLDLFFWFGPRLSARGPLQAMTDQLVSQSEASEEIVAMLRAGTAQSDLFTLLALQLPSMVRLLAPGQLPLAAVRPPLEVTSVEQTAGLGVVLGLMGLLLSTIYLVPIGRAVRDGHPRWAGSWASVWRAWLRQLALLGLLMAAAIGAAIPLAFITAVLTVAGLPLGTLILFVVQIVVILLLVYLFFVIDAIIVSGVGPVQAIRYSVAVVRNNFWSSIGLILLTVVISLGLPEVFKLFAGVAIGLPVAILANAYINTGLAAASMIFYRDRLAHWQQQQRAAALSRVGPGAPR
jgi:hypothetical protein